MARKTDKVDPHSLKGERFVVEERRLIESNEKIRRDLKGFSRNLE